MNKFIKKLAAVASCLAMVLVAGISLTACGKKEEPKGKISLTSYTTLMQSLYTASSKTASLVMISELTDQYKRINHELSSFGETLTESDYFLEFATLSDFDKIEKVTVGNQEFGTDNIYYYIGKNHYIASKPWKIENNKLYISYPVAYYEISAGNGKITINGVSASLPGASASEAAQKVAFTNAVKADNESTSEVTKGSVENNVLNVTLNIADGKSGVGLVVPTNNNGTLAAVKVTSDNTITYYGVDTTNFETNGDDEVLNIYPVPNSPLFMSPQISCPEVIGKTFEVSAIVLITDMENPFTGGTIKEYRAKIAVTANPVSAD